MKERSSFASYLSLNEMKGWLINMVIFYTVPIGVIAVLFLMLLVAGVTAAKGIINIVIVILPWVIGLLGILTLVLHIISCLDTESDKRKLSVSGVIFAIFNIPSCIACHYYLYLLMDTYARDFMERAGNGIFDSINTIFNFIFVLFIGGILYLTSVGTSLATFADDEPMLKRVAFEVISLITAACLLGFAIYSVYF